MRNQEIELESGQSLIHATPSVNMEQNEEELSGMNMPQIAEPGWAAELKLEHGFSPDASLKEMEGKATELLASFITALAAAELVLGRRIDASENDISPIIHSNTTAKTKFGLLLLQKSIENRAMELLSNPKTATKAAEMILGRKVAKRDTHVSEIIYADTTAMGKFQLLLTLKSEEEKLT